jgi:predicted DCC family thiol-disulfide oxidoreductase YuxK
MVNGPSSMVIPNPSTYQHINFTPLTLPLPPMNNPIVLFDGVCNFCNSTINFLIRQDKKGILRFAALQSETGQDLMRSHGLEPENVESFVLIYHGKAFTNSSGALTLFNHLPWYWKWTQLFWIIPSFIRNAIYRFIANNRYKWFGKKESCMIPTAEMRERFLS